MPRFLVIYASREGQTQKVAHRVAARLERLGHVARLINVGDDEPDAPAGDFDAAIIAGDLGSPMRASALAEFVEEHRDALRQVPSALLSVCLKAGATDTASREAVREAMQAFESIAGWRPGRTLAVGGAFHDRGHGAVRRAMLHIWMHLKGISPDPSGHTELTDWAALDEFVTGFARDIGAGEAKPA